MFLKDQMCLMNFMPCHSLRERRIFGLGHLLSGLLVSRCPVPPQDRESRRTYFSAGKVSSHIDADTCTLAVVTLDRFVYRELPGNLYKPYAQYDSATFRSIIKAGKVVMNDCLTPSKLAGWEPAGK
jgi:hypothetical protein